MRRNRQSSAMVFLTGAMLLPGLATAGEFSVGAGIGSSNVQGSRIADTDPTFVPGQRLDQSDTAFELFAAYRLNCYFSVEAGYQDFGNGGKTFATDRVFIPEEVPNTRQDVGITALSLGVVLEYPLADAFSLFALGGVARHDVNVRWSGGVSMAQPISIRTSENDSGSYYGAGIRYQFAEPWSLRLTWRGENVDGAGSDFDLSTFSAALAFHF